MKVKLLVPASQDNATVTFLRTAIELRDAEIARLTDLVERLSLDLALKETDTRIEAK